MNNSGIKEKDGKTEINPEAKTNGDAAQQVKDFNIIRDKVNSDSAPMTTKPSMTPWEVEGEIDYSKLIKEFGTQPLTNELFDRLKKPLPPTLRRGMCFSHRDLNLWLDAYDKGEKVSIVTGRGPSERMHIGHLTLYALPKYFQEAYKCTFYMPVSDDEKFLVKENLKFDDVEKYANDNILDILAMGFDPKRTIVHKDLEHTEIYKYAVQVSKKITYSTAKAMFGLKPEQNIGWVFYPAMQATHILYPQFKEGPHQVLVPIGIDQDPFIRLTRDIANKFDFVKPSAIHKKLAPGLAGPKMSSSGGEAQAPIWLSDNAKTVASKINKYAFSGGRATVEEHRKLGGNPDIDVSFQYLKFFFEDDDKKLKKVEDDYRSGALLTGELKAYFIEKVNTYLERHRERKEKVAEHIKEYMRV